MKDNQDINRHFSGPVYRFLSSLFGIFLVAVGIYVICCGVVSLPIRIGIGLLITVLGAETLWSAIQSKQPWLAKLGPFI
ncbi:MAG: hypothetical protein R3F24_06635 [Gammaproteobacteria bacterium]